MKRGTARYVRLMALTVVLSALLVVRSAPVIGQSGRSAGCSLTSAAAADATEHLNQVAPGDILALELVRSYTPAELARAAGTAATRYGAWVYRITYRSQAPVNTARLVTGLLYVPRGAQPPGGFATIVYGHATVGAADRLAPSRAPDDSAAELLPWVARGYMLSASDYVGLGTPGPLPYLVGEAAAYSMLDAGRAALRFCDSARGFDAPPAANQIFLVGHSEGGHAALFAAQYAHGYAPDLNVLGTVALAPASELREIIQKLASGFSPLVAPAAMTMYAFSQYYGAPADLHSWLQEPYASQIGARLNIQGVVGLVLWLGFNPSRVFDPQLLANVRAGRWDALQPWTGYMDRNTPGDFTSAAPVLIMHGTFDLIVPVQASLSLADRLCQHGTTTSLRLFKGVGHGVTDVARPEALQWMADRLAGAPAPSTCGQGSQFTALSLPSQAVSSLDRTLEPVIVQGSSVPVLLGKPVDQIFVYIYRAGGWVRIPAQVDERVADGTYTAFEDGVLDANDEVVFMAQDIGDEPPAPAQSAANKAESPMAAGQLPSGPSYTITVIDPLNPGHRGWAAVVSTTSPDPAPPDDYIQFDAGLHRLTGTTYRLGLASPNPWANYLALGSSATNLLDRTKTRIDCNIPIICPVKETGLPDIPDNLVKDGPVRVILRNGRLLAYGSMVTARTPVTLSQSIVTNLRLSTDFSPAASGSTIYTANAMGGLTVDGVADSTQATPLSPWWQLSTSSGTVIQVADSSSLGGTQTTYYRDDSALDLSDTGDLKHYGEVGISVANPSKSFTYAYALYFPAGSQPNVGATYLDFFAQPLQSEALWSGPSAYLPLVVH